MRVALTAAILLVAAPALAAPGDPRILRGSLEWPTTLSAEPFIVVRGDDGHSYYADVSAAKRMSPGSIAGRISLVGVEGNQAHEIAAVVVGAGDSALTYATPTVPTPSPAAPADPSSLTRQAVPAPRPAAVASSPDTSAAPATTTEVAPVATGPGGSDDLWQVRGKITAVSPREFVVETRPGETVRVDVSKLSAWTRDSVRAGDEVKLFGVGQNNHRLVANGFIQEVPPGDGRR